jgi:membrane-associated protease RseP (regulator of RpoE activity)
MVLDFGFVALLGIASSVTMAPPVAAAQASQIAQLLEEPAPLLLLHTSSQGYLGVDLADIDNEKAQALKLKEARGAVITLIDHDAPAGQIGLKINDVVLQLNGQTIESAEQLRRLLREIPAGRKVSIVISRDGNLQTLAVELADRRVMEQDVWNKIGSSGDPLAQPQEMGILAGGGNGSLPGGGFHMPIFGSSLNVGALVEPLTSQMAEYLGVTNGLMVKQVARKSAAATAGLKAFDVILKVGSDSITTSADWERSLHANQGKPVQVVILRDRKQQTVTLQVDSKRHQGALEEIFPARDAALLAEFGQKADQLKRQMEEFRKNFRPEDFKIDPRQMEEFRQHMKQWKRNLEELKPLCLADRT